MADRSGIEHFGRIGLKGISVKCFRDAQGFEAILPINLIIGRNNTGKSTLLDMINTAVNPSESGKLSGHLARVPRLVFDFDIDEQVADQFSTDGMIFTQNRLTYQDFCKKYLLGQRVQKYVFGGSDASLISEACDRIGSNGIIGKEFSKVIIENLFQNMGNPFARHVFGRMLADRDIKPEPVGRFSESLPLLLPDGGNATRLITRYLQQGRLQRAIVEEKIMDDLNSIFYPDASFGRIVPLADPETDIFEIYLEEPNKGLIPLAQMGSGVKTILLVLLNLHLMPDILRLKGSDREPIPLRRFLFGFEELENNLHPSLQRRLFLYLRKLAEREGCKFFITTHSHVVIDLFSRDEQAQIIHVTHDGECAKASRITTYVNHRSIFDDLEVRASDLLQTNAVVWVEGPSDRTYFNSWVELWTGGQLKEHVDYEVVFSAGTLLAHYSFDEPTEEEERIEALRVNGNAIVLIDSDKKQDEGGALKARAERVASEVREMGGVVWITAGKEVENYIPDAALTELLGKEGISPKNRFVNMFDFIKKHKGGNYSTRKADLAERVCKILTRNMLETHLDLAEKLDEVCGKIRTWNNRSRP